MLLIDIRFPPNKKQTYRQVRMGAVIDNTLNPNWKEPPPGESLTGKQLR